MSYPLRLLDLRNCSNEISETENKLPARRTANYRIECQTLDVKLLDYVYG